VLLRDDTSITTLIAQLCNIAMRVAAAKHGSTRRRRRSPAEASKWAPSPAAARHSNPRRKERQAPGARRNLPKPPARPGARRLAGEANWIIPSSSSPTNQRLLLRLAVRARARSLRTKVPTPKPHARAATSPL
jgi:hypothetical protein